MSYVYIVRLSDKDAFKIGKSESPAERIRELSRFYNFSSDEIYVIDCRSQQAAFKLESAFHSICDSHRVFFACDGGTEFFSTEIYPSFLKFAEQSAELKGASFTKISLATDNAVATKAVEKSKSDLLRRSLAYKVKQRRLALNISQQQLARASGVKLPTLRRFEQTGNCGVIHLANILIALDLDNVFNDWIVPVAERQRATEI